VVVNKPVDKNVGRVDNWAAETQADSAGVMEHE
jgi:hypothetical protein